MYHRSEEGRGAQHLVFTALYQKDVRRITLVQQHCARCCIKHLSKRGYALTLNNLRPITGITVFREGEQESLVTACLSNLTCLASSQDTSLREEASEL
jgi:hypothetical protein